jgi:hypothetical protein
MSLKNLVEFVHTLDVQYYLFFGRVGKPSPQSPVIFASSPSSPLKEFLDSPITRQVTRSQYSN